MLYESVIGDMLAELMRVGIVSEENRKQAEEALIESWKNRIAIVWDVQDILELYCPDGDPDYWMTEEHAREILNRVHRHHDATYGINWDTLDTHISEYTQEFIAGIPAVDLPKYINTFWGEDCEDWEELYKNRLKEARAQMEGTDA